MNMYISLGACVELNPVNELDASQGMHILNMDRCCQIYLPQTLRQLIFEPIVWREPTFQHHNTEFLKGCVCLPNQ